MKRRNLFTQGGWHPQPQKALRTISRPTELFAEAFGNSSSPGKIPVFFAHFFKPLIKDFWLAEAKMVLSYQGCFVYNSNSSRVGRFVRITAAIVRSRQKN